MQSVHVSPLTWLIKAALAHLRGKAAAGPKAFVFPDDVFLVSFPRSGNTWTRFLLGNSIFRDEPVTFANVESRIPDIYINSQQAMLRLPRPRVLKSHEPFDPRYGKMIYIVRDPRDVAVSSYHYMIKRKVIDENYPIEAFIRHFLTGALNGTAGSWGENVATWLAVRGDDREFLLLRYEDMLQDTARELRKVVSFLQLGISELQLARAIDLSSADRMRALEKKQSLVWKRTRHDRQDKAFVRVANSGDWKLQLPVSSVAQIETAWGSVMRILGYELSSESQCEVGLRSFSSV
jgi:hypothetical protein